MEELRKNLVIGGTRYSLAVGQDGEGPPGSDTPGKVCVTYLDTLNKRLYVCTAAVAGTNGIECEWTPAGDLIEVTAGGNGSQENPSQGGLTTAQVSALHGMFQVMLFDDSKDVDGAISAFETAFGITDSGGGTGGGDSGGEDSGGGDTTGDALPTNGLMAYFDLRNLGDKANVTVGTTKGVMATQGNGALYSWTSEPITSSDEYGAVLPRNLFFNPNGQSAEYDMGNEFTVVVCTRGGVSGWNMSGSNTAYAQVTPVYITADGTARVAGTDVTGDKTGYNTQVYCINGNIATMYLNAAKFAEYAGDDYDGFVRWQAIPTVGTIWNGGSTVAAALYNRVLTETEVVEIQAFMKTLEVSA